MMEDVTMLNTTLLLEDDAELTGWHQLWMMNKNMFVYLSLQGIVTTGVVLFHYLSGIC